MCKIIIFPRSTDLDNIAFIEHVAAGFRERSLPPSGSKWTQKELLSSLLVSLKRELDITDKELDDFVNPEMPPPIISHFL